MNPGSVVQEPSALTPVNDSIDELKRELRIRKLCYDRWVAEGKISWTQGRDQFHRLFSAIAWLEQFASSQRLKVLPIDSGTEQAEQQAPSQQAAAS